jgi:AraC-like DNA-binding protein
VNELIEKHIKEGEFNVDILCTKIGMSRTSFYNKLRSLTGHPPADYIRIIKIEKSKQMLATTSMPMAEIAEACGFYDAKYFREVFRKNVGISPREFRQGCGTNKTEE